MAEFNGSNVLQRRYVHCDQVDEPWMQYNGINVGTAYRRYLLAGHQGSIIAQADGSGNTLNTLAYDSFGIPATKNANAPGAFGYTGQIYLPGVGLNYYKARMYSPKIGRFLQTDPIGYEDNMNLYAYVGNDLLNKFDPTGKNTVVGAAAGCAMTGPACLVGAIVGAVVGAVIIVATVVAASNAVNNESSESASGDNLPTVENDAAPKTEDNLSQSPESRGSTKHGERVHKRPQRMLIAKWGTEIKL